MPYETVDKPGEPYVTKRNRNKATVAPDRVYTQAEVDSILERRQQEQREGEQREGDQRQRRSNEGRNDDEGEGTVVGIDPKLLKQLQSTVTVFNTLKEFASSPLQKAIETEVGTMAVGAIKQSFGQPAPKGNKDFFDMVLNSQFALGLGQSLGSRGPEMVESMGRTFGKDRTDRFIDNMLDQYGKSPKDSNPNSVPNSIPNSSGSSGSSGKRNPTGPGISKDENINMLLSLCPDNPEHVAAYADSQGGIRVEMARKMLMMHQDEIIEQMRLQGLDTSGFGQTENVRNAHVQEEEEVKRLKREQQEMLMFKRQLDQQIQQLPQEDLDNQEKQEKQEKVISYKDIHKKAEIVKPKEEETNRSKVPTIEDIVEIPDKWDQNDLNEVESESIRKAELARKSELARKANIHKDIKENIKETNSIKEANSVSGIKEANEANGINDVKEIGEKDIADVNKVIVPTMVQVPENDTVPIIMPVSIEETKQQGDHIRKEKDINTLKEKKEKDTKDDKPKYKFKVIYGMLKKILLDANGKETAARSTASEEEIVAYEKKHEVKIRH